MKQLITIVAIFGFILVSCDNDITIKPTSDTHFVKYYGSKGDQEGRDMAQVVDGYVLLGRSDSDDFGKQIYLVKTDYEGNEIWNSLYGGIYNEDPASIVVTSSGQLLISSTVYYPNGTSDMVFYLINTDGVLSDSVILGTTANTEVAKDAIELSDNSFMFLGTTDEVNQLSDPTGKETAINLYRTSSNTLDTLPKNDFSAYWGEGIRNEAAGLIELNSRYFVLGTSDSDGANTNGDNLITFEIDGGGLPIENKYWGTDDDQYAAEIVTKTDGNFLVVGTTNNGATTTIYIQEITQSLNPGTTIFVNRPNLEAKDILDASLGYIILGTETVSATNTDIYLSYVDSFGVIQWETTFGGEEIDTGESGLFMDVDGGIILLGTIDLGSQNKMALIKVNNDGLLNP